MREMVSPLPRGLGGGAEPGAAGPTASSSMAASSLISGLLLHPGANLAGDPLGLRLLDDRALLGRGGLALIELDLVLVLGLDERVRLELGERGRRLDLAQPDRLAHQLLVLALAQLARQEEEEDEGPDAEADVLEDAHHPAHRARPGGVDLGERHLADAQRVAAL